MTNAAAAGCIPLVRFLLHHGASPHHKNGLAIHAAIRRKDLSLVKMLIEPDNTAPSRQGGGDRRKATKDQHWTAGTKRARNDTVTSQRSGKKRRLEDRVAVDREMLKTAVACNAQDIVLYFVHEKSCVPDMQTLRLIRSIGL